MAEHPSNSLRNTVTFPTISLLPTEDNPESPHYRYVTPFYMSQARHWCFLAEIVAVEPWVRLFLRVKDKEGMECVVAFHDTGRGSSFMMHCTPGKTIAIVDPDLHFFMDGQVGIRLEDDDISGRSVKVIPFGLPTLLKANDLVMKVKGDDKQCEHCGKKDKKLCNCARCGTFYCSKECQTANWTKEHKSLCKAMKEVEWFAGKDWGRTRANISFPS